jgi:Na+-translocating ferredoxin:NAD+ oxidoreductase RnfD subunit
MGTGCALLMVGCCAYLFVRRRKALLATLGFVCACALWAAIDPRINASVPASIMLELCSGSLLFAAVFLVTDHATLSQNSVCRVICGAICGFFCMAMRKMGAYEETVCFAVLMANAFSPVIESALKNLPSTGKTKRKEAAEK